MGRSCGDGLCAKNILGIHAASQGESDPPAPGCESGIVSMPVGAAPLIGIEFARAMKGKCGNLCADLFFETGQRVQRFRAVNPQLLEAMRVLPAAKTQVFCR